MSILGSMSPVGIAANVLSKMVQPRQENAQQKFPGIRRGSLGEHTIRMLDQDGDGMLSRQEFLRPQMDTLKASRGDEIFDRWDADGDGMLTLGEVNAAIARAQLRRQAIQIVQGAMLTHDADGDGALSATELALPEDIFAEVDADGDGLIQGRELAHAHFMRMQPEDA